MLDTNADVLVIGGGFGGVSAALAVLRRGRSVILTEETAWLGGQLTSQLVPTDEHIYIERTGANQSYRDFRGALRDHYRRWYPLTSAARADPHLNPGAAWVSPVSVEPRVALSVIESMLLPYEATGRLQILRHTRPVAVESDGDIVQAVVVESVVTGERSTVTGTYILDATELGELLEQGGVEFTSGREAQADTGEPGAAETADPTDMQGVTWCFVMDHRAGEDHTIDRPANYERHRDAIPPHATSPRRQLSFVTAVDAEGAPAVTYGFHPDMDDDPFAIDLDHHHMGAAPELWNYRRVAARRQFTPGFYASDIVVVNWLQNDYTDGPLFGVPDAQRHWQGAKDLSAATLYWLQTEAPRPDGGTGWPGLRLRPDIAGTEDGFAMMPYIRESRRIRACKTIVEQEVSLTYRPEGAVQYRDTVGTGHYFWIDRHPTTGGHSYPGSLPQPFEIPLGALVPQRVRNLIPACKNIGTTQITNGCYRLHPVEWSIGEAAGALAAFCLRTRTEPHAVLHEAARLEDFQDDLTRGGVQLRWDPSLLA
jgi:hypothetical protein